MADAFDNHPEVGKPGGAASRFLRVDFGPETAFDSLIETKCPRLGWARAVICPCKSFSGQTEQVNPSCTKCNGLGWRYFQPPRYAVKTDLVGPLTDEQRGVLGNAKAVVIRGLMVSLTEQPDIFQAIGHFALGSAMLTVRAANRMSYYDRIISIDEIMTYSEWVPVGETNLVDTKYPVVSVNCLVSDDVEFSNTEVRLDGGVLTWKTGKKPAVGTVVSINYNCHPTWLVIQHTKLYRTSLVKNRKVPATLDTPEGDNARLPSQVLVRLAHLPMDPG